MPRLARQPLAAFLDDLAKSTPAPGGGSAAASACALGAALVEMAARIELERGASSLDPALPDRVRALRLRALDGAEQELSAYEPVLAARRRPRDDPERPGRMARALEQASAGLVELTELAAEAAEHGVSVARDAEAAVRGDALTGVVLCEGAAAAAGRLVEINLTDGSESQALARVREGCARAAAARQAALGADDAARPG